MAAREEAGTVSSLPEFVSGVVFMGESIDRIAELAGVKWFRGCGDIKYLLEPSLLRTPYSTHVSGNAGPAFEARMLQRFINRAHAFANVPTNGVDRLVLMQHYGHPTRLLDWTENALTALYFAVRDENEECDACVWFLAAQGLARRVARIEQHPDNDGEHIPGSDDTFLNQRAADPMGNGRMPVPFYPANLNARVAAQGGCFTLHSFDPGGLEDMARAKDGSYLFPIRIPRTSKRAMLAGLRTLGITESILFPDLDGLAREARMLHGDNPFKRSAGLP